MPCPEKKTDHRHLFAFIFVTFSLGFALGLLFPKWQIAVEGGQVLSGRVSYPHDHPNYLYLTGVWTLLHQITSFFLSMGMTEKTLSFFISGVCAGLSYCAIALILHEYIQARIHAALLPFILLFLLGLPVFTANYDLMLFYEVHTYGMLSFSLVLLSAGLALNAMFRTSAFISAILPAIHIGWGVIWWTVIFFSLIRKRKKMQDKAGGIIGFFLTGAAVSLASLGYHTITLGFPFHPVTRELSPYLEAFAAWERHRKAVPVFCLPVFLNVLVIAYTAFTRKKKKEICLSREIFETLTQITAIIGIIMTLLSHLPLSQANLLQSLILSRSLNFATVIGVILVFAYLRRFFFYPLLFVCFTFIPLSQNFLAGLPHNAVFFICFALFFFLALVFAATIGFDPVFKKTTMSKLQSLLKNICYRGIPSFFILAWILMFSFSRHDRIWQNFQNPITFLAASLQDEGMLLTSGGLFLVQARTERPVLLFAQSIDFIPYVPETAPKVAAILKDVYGIDYFHPPQEVIGRGGLVPGVEKKPWEAYRLDKWRAIRKKYMVTQVLVPNSYELCLPVIVQDANYCLYSIPHTEAQEEQYNSRHSGF